MMSYALKYIALLWRPTMVPDDRFQMRLFSIKTNYKCIDFLRSAVPKM